ncbi:SUR7/PalI family-domain-containing protein [Ampelomyces quisqualis]|uniref:SUR7/PalI family-domain-containing protein n=1 Tax=Ampelomyces quisqualis TaxID=50730 RepID=A0A6A5R7E8_AMPQU|nr:SUR7/PalI family-domain-containing protein [Ampelomyces quisqualis]
MRFFNLRRPSDDTAAMATDVPPYELSKQQIKRATRTRKTWSLTTSFFLFVALVFLILVEIANIKNKSIINDWYFIKLDLSNVVPSSVPNFALINTIAQSLGLHDFYQVGLWGFCEGYRGEGVTFCSEPQTLYWFNPVEILRNELLAGASINLPSDINDILDLIQYVSQWMFGLFLTGTCLTFVLIFLMPVSVFTRWLALPVAILAFLNALIVTAASIIATVMFIIFRNTITGVAELNIGAEIGVTVFVFMWIASAFAIFAWLVQMGLCCCCASRRDVKTGRKRGSEKAYHSALADVHPTTAGAKVEGPRKKRFWQRR